MTSPGVWDFAPPGYPSGTVTYTGPILFPNGINPGATQTVVMVFGPGGGQLTVPPLTPGESGPPPELRDVNVTTVPYGQNLPVPAATWSQVALGAPGVAAVYDLNYSLNAGEPGDPGTYYIKDADDLAGGIDALFDQAALLWNSTSSEFVPTALPVGAWFNATTIAGTGENAGQTRNLSYIGIEANTIPFAWWPIVFATSTIEGTSNTQVDLVARMTTPTGFELARGPGQSGAVTGAQPYVTYLLPTFGGGLLSAGNGQVEANAAVTIYLNAEQQANTQDTYVTSNTRFAVGVAPVPA